MLSFIGGVIFSYLSIVSIEAALFNAHNVKLTDTVTVSLGTSFDNYVSRRSPSDSLHNEYNIKFHSNGNLIEGRLTKSKKINNIISYKDTNGRIQVESDYSKRDWDIYESEDLDGHFLIKRENNGLLLEGYMRHAGKPYMVQPLDAHGNHVLHTLNDNSVSENYDKIIRRSIHQKRSSKQYSIELYFVVDDQVAEYIRRRTSKSAEEIEAITRQYYAMIITGIANRLKSLSPINIGIESVGLEILTKPIPGFNDLQTTESKDGIRKVIDAVNAINLFKSWMNSRKGLPTRDLEMLLTGYDLKADGSDANGGIASVGAFCTSDKQSIVEFGFSVNTIQIAAHELGHSLGSNHDGDGTEGKTCEKTLGNVMAPSSYMDSPFYFWKFSSCSYNMIHNRIKKSTEQGLTCLEKSTTHPSVSNPHYGNKLDIHEQCKLITGNAFGLYVSRVTDIGQICLGMPCYEANNMYSTYIPIAGTPCGNKKWCEFGECKSNENAKEIDEKCPFGDDKKSCASVINHNGNCYSQKIAKSCCGFCKKAYTGIKGCEYGDRAGNCKAMHAQYGDRLCYTAANRDSHCCKLCTDIKSEDKDCPYGDRVPGCVAIKSHKPTCLAYMANCCKTCSIYKTR